MDTQGVFDNKSTVKDNVSLFALTNLISSVQVCWNSIFFGILVNMLQVFESSIIYWKNTIVFNKGDIFKTILDLQSDATATRGWFASFGGKISVFNCPILLNFIEHLNWV